jgi:ubiquinone/menaquinone biosynthesis C-methylase UbiE
MKVEAIDTSYEPFSHEPEYVELNKSFLEALELEGPLRVLDLACGTCTLTSLLLDQVDRQATIVGIDLSRRSLELARSELGELEPPARVDLVEATADRLPVTAHLADLVIMGNAIHCLPDLDVFLDEVARALKPGGIFAFNSSFYAGTFVPGTERFYDEWMKEAARYVLQRDRELKSAGLPGIRRLKGRAGPAFSRRWLSPAEFRALLERHGFEVFHLAERTVMMSRRAFETVGAYEGLAAVLLSGYPVDLACEALTRSVVSGLDKVGLTEVPRYWLEVAAVKPGQGT